LIVNELSMTSVAAAVVEADDATAAARAAAAASGSSQAARRVRIRLTVPSFRWFRLSTLFDARPLL
jgi:hypothetical protein